MSHHTAGGALLLPVREAERPKERNGNGAGKGPPHWVSIADSGAVIHLFVNAAGMVTKGPHALIGAKMPDVEALPHDGDRHIQHHPVGHVPPGHDRHPAYHDSEQDQQQGDAKGQRQRGSGASTPPGKSQGGEKAQQSQQAQQSKDDSGAQSLNAEQSAQALAQTVQAHHARKAQADLVQRAQAQRDLLAQNDQRRGQYDAALRSQLWLPPQPQALDWNDRDAVLHAILGPAVNGTPDEQRAAVQAFMHRPEADQMPAVLADEVERRFLDPQDQHLGDDDDDVRAEGSTENDPGEGVRESGDAGDGESDGASAHWITLKRGPLLTHVQVDREGVIQKGPPHLRGRDLAHLPPVRADEPHGDDADPDQSARPAGQAPWPREDVSAWTDGAPFLRPYARFIRGASLDEARRNALDDLRRGYSIRSYQLFDSPQDALSSDIADMSGADEDDVVSVGDRYALRLPGLAGYEDDGRDASEFPEHYSSGYDYLATYAGHNKGRTDADDGDVFEPHALLDVRPASDAVRESDVADTGHGHWITLHGSGTHVYIEDGRVTKGPPAFHGKTADEALSGQAVTHHAPDEEQPTDRPSSAQERAEAAARGVVVPPRSWNLWVNPDPDGKVQATWTDSKGRKQYGYHPRAVAERDAHKFGAVQHFSEMLPRLRQQVQRDLSLSDAQKQRVAAAAVALIDQAHIRVGSEQYAQENGTYGASSLRANHVSITGPDITLSFTGKHHVTHDVTVRDPAAAQAIGHLKALAEQSASDGNGGESRLFQYHGPDGRLHPLGETGVNDYLKQFGVTAKQFRTHYATRTAAEMLAEAGPPSSPDEAKKTITRVVKAISEQLGNTPAVCRSSYINPAILDAYAKGIVMGGATPAPTGQQGQGEEASDAHA